MRKRVAVRIVGQLEDDEVSIENGHGSVFIKVAAAGEDAIAMVSPETAEEIARLLVEKAEESRSWR